MKKNSPRTTYFMGFLAVIALLGIVAYLQAFKGFEPCPLCLLQRFALIVLGILFFIGTLLKLKKPGQFLINLLAILFSGIGAFLAGRQVWLQHLPPDQNAGCGASLDYMLQAFPLKDVLQQILAGSSECSQVGLEFFHVSLAGWSLVSFCIFILVSFWQFCRLFCGQKEGLR
jgi:disulfide bond formation protein DsbB